MLQPIAFSREPADEVAGLKVVALRLDRSLGLEQRVDPLVKCFETTATPTNGEISRAQVPSDANYELY